MKTNNSLKMILLITSLVLSTNLFSQVAPKTATARIFESFDDKYSRIIVVYENGESEIIPLQIWEAFGKQESKDEVFINNQITINKMINDMKIKGYKVSKMNTLTDNHIFYTLILFDKD